jgi:Tfp pilus assembly protein PilF
MAHAEKDPAPLRDLRQDVPSGLISVIRKMTAKAPDDRYRTPAQVALALEKFVSNEPLTVLPAADDVTEVGIQMPPGIREKPLDRKQPVLTHHQDAAIEATPRPWTERKIVRGAVIVGLALIPLSIATAYLVGAVSALRRDNAALVKSVTTASAKPAPTVEPARSNAAYLQGNNYFARKEYDHALMAYEDSIRSDGKFFLAHVGRGDVRRMRKDYEKALADYNEAIRLNPKHATAFSRRGMTWQYLKDYEKASADYDQAIRLDSNVAEYLNNKAWLLATCPVDKYRNGPEAVRLAERACSLTGLKDPTMIDTLAAAYAETGKFKEAITWQKKAWEFPSFEPQFGDTGRARLRLYEANKPYRLTDADNVPK